MPRSWQILQLLLFLAWYCLSLSLRHMPCGSLFVCSKVLDHLVVARPHSVTLDSCVDFFSVLLLDQFSSIIFLVPKHILMRGDWRRISHLVPGHVLPLGLLPTFFRFHPGRLLSIRAWARGHSLVFGSFFLKTFHPRGKCILRLDDGYAEFLQTVHWQVLGWLHALADLIEPSRSLVTSRTYKFLIETSS